MNYTNRLDALLLLLLDVGDDNFRNDLLKMHKNVQASVQQLSVAAVECRRIHRPTSEFTTLDAKFSAQFSELEQWLTFALLL